MLVRGARSRVLVGQTDELVPGGGIHGFRRPVRALRSEYYVHSVQNGGADVSMQVDVRFIEHCGYAQFHALLCLHV